MVRNVALGIRRFDGELHPFRGCYGLVKDELSGESAIEDGVSNPRKLAHRIDCEKMVSLAFVMAVSGVRDISYPRGGGVTAVPLRTLRSQFGELLKRGSVEA